MSYYILPNNNNINLSFKMTTEANQNNVPFISHSLFFYFNQLNKKVEELINQVDISSNLYNEIKKNIHPFEYIYTKVPGTCFSVSKIRDQPSLFYDMFEIINTMSIFDSFDQSINAISFSKDNQHVMNCIEIMREKYENDTYQSYEELNSSCIQTMNNNTFDFIFYETKTETKKSYVYSFIRIILFILHYQNYRGTTIIKINETFEKPIIELIYTLTTFFEKTYIIKPNSSNVTSFEKYIVCKCFIPNPIHKQYSYDLFKIIDQFSSLNNEKIVSILDRCDVPYYFLNKLDDLNIIIGQQQLETLNLWINILKNKNRDDKIEMQKRNNLQRCIHWCERLKIPCNRFPERLNMFLPILSEPVI